MNRPLLTGYVKRIFRPTCNPSFESVHCIACLNEDISEALPYLNAMLGGKKYFRDPPEVLFQHYGKLIKVGALEIAINALKDEDEADRMLTCTVFAVQMAEGGLGPEQCRDLSDENRDKLVAYLAQFDFD